MRADAGSAAAPFPTTRWSEVARAGDADPHVRRAALGRLLVMYLPAFRAHLLGRLRIPPDRADDLLQGFVCDRVVAEDLVARADQERGRFRGYVVVALDRYVAAVRRAEGAARRKPGRPVLGIGDAEPPAAGGGAAPDAFDLAWAREVVERAIREMRERCDNARGGDNARGRVWVAFDACTLGPLLRGELAPPQQALARQLGLASAQQVANTLVTARRMFARVLRGIVSEYAADERAIDAELRDLWEILSRAGAAGRGR